MKVILGNIFLSYGGIETARFLKASRIRSRGTNERYMHHFVLCQFYGQF